MSKLTLFYPDGRLFYSLSLTELETKLFIENYYWIKRLCGLGDKLEVINGS